MTPPLRNPAWPQAPYWSSRSTLFIHIPKTGGTTLDSIFRDHYFDTPLIPSTPFNIFGKQIRKFNDPAYSYVGGHYPISTIDITRFDKKVTVLRDALDSLCSGISYVNKLRGVPQATPIESEKAGLPALTYKKFFTPHFDTERYLLDLSYNMTRGMRQYLFECSAQDAVENIRKFTHVFDFENLDGEIKRFLIEENYFPYAEIGKKRQYQYTPDYERGKALLSEFDETFYRLSTPLIKKLPGNINAQYEQYREHYSLHHGLELQVHEGKLLDLRMPIGTGWHHAEQSESKVTFRWSEPKRATIEIPLAKRGMYALYLYIHPGEVKRLQLSAVTTVHRGKEIQPTLTSEAGVSIFRFLVTTHAHDWVHVSIDMDGREAQSKEDADERDRGIVLGNVYVCRHPA